ncbi:MAG: hypothetical protein ABJN62_01320 [Halioglobus sp.]
MAILLSGELRIRILPGGHYLKTGRNDLVKNTAYLGMRPGDLDDKPYAKYWNPEMQGLSEQVAQAVMQSPLPKSYGFSHKESHHLLEPQPMIFIK